ncbi:A disintegrin and metalloproteinase with thrombospondin motifs 9 [Larimichthys crocea]|uniref:Uncharacterized protein n=1 Tax=Larimichthys crocea TaxID=215358 RepID=A0ACD3QDX3_LARCR|nr:A disintegrin and metalloproteinase with thrombospondin motifs 9 [Larimichthys crocea]
MIAGPLVNRLFSELRSGDQAAGDSLCLSEPNQNRGGALQSYASPANTEGLSGARMPHLEGQQVERVFSHLWSRSSEPRCLLQTKRHWPGSEKIYVMLNSVLQPSVHAKLQNAHITLGSLANGSNAQQTCGAGVMERRVECVTSKGQPSKHCRPSEKPESQAACQDRECQLFTSCREVQMRQGVKIDGEYYLKVKSRILQIYCAEMQTDFPKEYVTLRSGQTDNYSEVYGYRLLNPFECPYNGSRRQDCDCRNDYSAAGYTLFHKVRLDLSSLRIMITDLQFSQTLLGRPVPFATAGDCYSAAKCPQGQFSINLIGTGLKVAEATKWTSQGNYVSCQSPQI